MWLFIHTGIKVKEGPGISRPGRTACWHGIQRNTRASKSFSYQSRTCGRLTLELPERKRLTAAVLNNILANTKLLFHFLLFFCINMALVTQNPPQGRQDTLRGSHHSCWWLCDARNQGISSHGIGLALPEYSTSHARGVRSTFHARRWYTIIPIFWYIEQCFTDIRVNQGVSVALKGVVGALATWVTRSSTVMILFMYDTQDLIILERFKLPAPYRMSKKIYKANVYWYGLA